MKIEELRIGNLVNKPKHGIYCVARIDEKCISTTFEYNMCYPIDIFEPLDLDEEWLLKFGFGDTAGGWEDHGNLVVLYLSTGDYTISKEQVKYVHQLQNLYFALTGKELSI